MKVGLVIYGSLDTLSGGYLYDRNLVRHLKDRGDTVTVLSLPWQNYTRHLGHNLTPALFNRLARLDVDILLQDELNHPSLFLINRWLKRRVKYPIISIVHHLRISEHHPKPLLWLYRLIERAYLDTVDAFVFNSNTTRESVNALRRRDAPSVVAYPAGDRLQSQLDEIAIRDRVMQAPPLKILFVGNLIPRKGLHTLLHALKEIPPEQWRLTIVGSPEADRRYSRKIKHMIGTFANQGNIRLLGALDARALQKEYEQHHLLAVPSQYEGFGIVYIEGMGFGLPAIATTGGAAKEIITHGVNGFLLPPETPELLREQIVRLAQDRDVLLALSLAALTRYREHPTWEETGAQTRAFLQGLCVQKGI